MNTLVRRVSYNFCFQKVLKKHMKFFHMSFPLALGCFFCSFTPAVTRGVCSVTQFFATFLNMPGSERAYACTGEQF